MRVTEFLNEDADKRKQNALWAQITAHEKAAKQTKDIKRDHHLKMADQLRSQLKTTDNVAEGEVVAFPKKHKGDLGSVNDCPKCGGDLQGGKYMGHQVKVCMPCKQVYLPPNSGIDQQGNKIDEAGFDYTVKDLGNDYAGFPSNHSLKHKFLAKIKPEKRQLYKDKMNNMQEFDQLFQLFKVAKQRGDIIEQGVAEGANDTVYPGAEVIKSKNGKPVGEIYQDASGWGCFHYRADNGADSIESREEAIEWLKDLHDEYRQDRSLREQSVSEEKTRLDPSCWHNKKIGNPKTKMKGGVRVNNCVPKEGVAEMQLTPLWQDDPEHLEYRKKQADISRNTGLAVGDLVTLKDRPGFKGKIVRDWGGGDFTISGSDGGMSQSNNHRANARNIQKLQGVAEDFNAEYDDEAGMADNNLSTLRRAVDGLDDLIDSGDNLPEWCQEKIAVAKSMLVAVWDYMDSADDAEEEFDLVESIVDRIAAQNGVDAEMVWEDLESLSNDELYAFAVTSQLNEDWSKVNKRDKTDGMSSKAVKAYRREHPGSKLKTAVTTKPSKLKKGSKASKRRKSYCSRSKGQMNMHNISCAKTPDKAICKARRRWNC